MSDTPAPALDKDVLAQELRRHLAEASWLRQMRLTEAAAQDHLRLKSWQSARLARTHADLAADPRYAVATAFFLDELYGPHDFTQRDAELARVLPKLVSMLPAKALATLVDAIQMDALSESLDADMVRHLRSAGRAGRIDANAYAEAYRACGRARDRALQIELVDRIGHRLDRLTHLPLLGVTLKMMRRPAERAGLGELHQFLRQGFDAFRSMRGAEVFLATITERETALMKRLFAGGLP